MKSLGFIVAKERLSRRVIRWPTLKVYLICDPMFNLYGPICPPLEIAKVIAKRKHNVSVVSTKMSDSIRKLLKSYHMKPIDLNVMMVTRRGTSISWFESWAREAFFNLNSRSFLPDGDVVINFSQTIAVPATVWYVQGPVTDFLNDAEQTFPMHYRPPYKIFKLLLTQTDSRLLRHMALISKLIVANSKFCASMYEKRGIKVHSVIYPPLDCSKFKPTSTPSGDYVLTYCGKETEFYTLKKIGDSGVRIKSFGSKTPYIPKKIREHKNIEFLGRVSSKELVTLYSNALFTLFTFTHEPFGYIPVESMACGTPVLTYNRQGPSEAVSSGATGWLVDTDEEITHLASRLWKDGYPSTMRMKARRRAMLFNVKEITEKWLQVIEGGILGENIKS